MQIKPILFNTESVRAILAGEKTQTRRPLKPQPQCADGIWTWKDCQWMDGWLGFPASGIEDYAPYQCGDILYIRETWNRYVDSHTGNAVYIYKTHCRNRKVLEEVGGYQIKWRPAIHMPREAARLFLKVTNVSVERLQTITEEGARAEGVEPLVFCSPPGESPAWEKEVLPALPHFPSIWDNTLKRGDRDRYGWSANPYVWVIKFQRCEKPEGFDSGK